MRARRRREKRGGGDCDECVHSEGKRNEKQSCRETVVSETTSSAQYGRARKVCDETQTSNLHCGVKRARPITRQAPGTGTPPHTRETSRNTRQTCDILLVGTTLSPQHSTHLFSAALLRHLRYLRRMSRITCVTAPSRPTPGWDRTRCTPSGALRPSWWRSCTLALS